MLVFAGSGISKLFLKRIWSLSKGLSGIKKVGSAVAIVQVEDNTSGAVGLSLRKVVGTNIKWQVEINFVVRD